MPEFIHFEVTNRVGILTLNRPEKRNALSQKFVLELITAFKKAEDNKAVKVIVLNAKGTTFSAGADLVHLQKLQSYSYEQNLDDSNDLKYLFSTMYHLEKPIIAQVQGDAIAGGCGLVTACDIVFSIPEARFGYTEVKIGFVPALVAPFLIRKIGEGRTREMLLSGELITSETAKQYGLVNFVVQKDEIESIVNLYAKKITDQTSAESICTTKQLLAKLHSLSIEDSIDHAAKVNARARLSDDCKKGITAFLNKKPLEW